MHTATYSLLTLRPDPERIDLLCVGAVVLDSDSTWHVSAPGPRSKLLAFDANPDHLSGMASNLQSVLSNCTTLQSARTTLSNMRSAMAIHEFEGMFSYSTWKEFTQQVLAILDESVIPAKKSNATQGEEPIKIIRQRTHAKLRKQFEDMGIFAKHSDEINNSKIVPNYPIAVKHGLKAEFAIKSDVMNITETVDFDVSEVSVRTKTFEAQAKCLVMRAARDIFGESTQCHIVVSGSSVSHAARTIDLLSTVGTLYATESAEDMHNYINCISIAAGNPVMPTRH